MIDLFVSCGEVSGDLHGSTLIKELQTLRPDIKIGGVLGPKIRETGALEVFPMERLLVMGFIDVFKTLPKLVRLFFQIRNTILKLNPEAVVFIDYPGLHLRLAKSLRKKGYQGKLIHYICPTVWAWGKKRVPQMAKTLDSLLTIFPFEPKCFAHTSLKTEYIGHPLAEAIRNFVPKNMFKGKILGVFPGSRLSEIDRNLQLQLHAAKTLKQLDPDLEIYVSELRIPLNLPDVHVVKSENRYELMDASHMAIATSGTVNLELALFQTPTVVNFFIRKLDCFIAQKLLRINLPYYCIANIILNRQVFPELYGPNLTEESLLFWAQKLWFDEKARDRCKKGWLDVLKSLGINKAQEVGAHSILSTVDF